MVEMAEHVRELLEKAARMERICVAAQEYAVACAQSRHEVAYFRIRPKNIADRMGQKVDIAAQREASAVDSGRGSGYSLVTQDNKRSRARSKRFRRVLPLTSCAALCGLEHS